MYAIARPLCLLSLLLSAATFGFFYAWVCSTMWGLDNADPRVAIQAMQAMNAAVRNAVFAPAFFGAPIALLVTSIVLFQTHQRRAALWFGVGFLFSLFLGVILTMVILVPMNEALALIEVPEDIEAARAIWQDYSPDWQFWNQTRTVTTGLALFCVGMGFLQLRVRMH